MTSRLRAGVKPARAASPQLPRARSATRRQIALAASGLIVLVLAVFGQTVNHGFIAYDDPSYVTDNATVQHGVTREGLRWALTTSDGFYWHPITWISHMIDCGIYGLAPAGHHATSIAIHGATVLLLFGAFLYMTGAVWRSAAVAAAFAVHPLNVEPVAWIAERKELLAGFFWFAAILAYAWYALRPALGRYLLVCAGFALGLMSKPVVVTLPFALLLLDVWPLERIKTTPVWRLVIEKAPLAVLSIASSLVTYAGTHRAGAMMTLAHVPITGRVAHAAVACAIYLRQFVWPAPLAVLYPYSPSVDTALLVTAVAIIAGLTAAAVRLRARAPYVLAGWAWFLVALVPTIGLIQVGPQWYADRFMHLPMVGLLMVVMWGAADVLRPSFARYAAAAALAALAVVSTIQARYWRDSVTLMSHTVAVTDENPVALHLLAYSLAEQGRVADAVPVYRESLRLKPHNPLAWYNLGLALEALRRVGDAAACFTQAVRFAPSYAEAHYSLGEALMDLNRRQEARGEFEAALRLPLSADYAAQAAFRLGLIGAYDGDFARAEQGFQQALRFRPDFPEARANLERARQVAALRH